MVIASRVKTALRQVARNLGLGPGVARSAPAYRDEELIRRTEEFNEAAELYWQAICKEPTSRRQILNKPLSTISDTPGLVYRLGLVLDALDLGVGLRVLDFGAGGCWLASFLNRLRCRTVAMDVSRTALALGRDLFESDPRHHLELDPQFLPYDGHHVDLPDESMDRVVMFDAFHHVPNQVEVLAEIFRVLKPGGRAVFGEPGEGHAHTDQSLYESEATGVLENDLDLVDVERKARNAGFSAVLLKPYPQPSLVLTASEYRRLIDGEERLYPMAALREDLRHFYIFILQKGEPRHDSRNPRKLAAEIRLADQAPRLTGRACTYLPLRFLVRNQGDTEWLREEAPEGGYVMLGGHVLDQQGRHLKRGHLRARLPRNVAPGEEVLVEAELLLPAPPARYRVRVDMVDEFISWFEQVGSPTLDIEVEVDGYLDSRHPHQLKADLDPPAETRLTAGLPGAPLRVPLRVHNAGDTTWLARTDDSAGQVLVGGHLLRPDGSTLDWDFFRTGLPRDVAPGERADLVCEFAAPPDAGSYRVRIDLVADRVGWFESWGSLPIDLALEVAEGVPDSRAPGRLRAQLEWTEPTPGMRAAAGTTAAVRIRVKNAGNTRWLAAPQKAPGYVFVGGHLLDEKGAMLDLDHTRAPLPRDLAPGEEATVAVSFGLPSRPGRYQLELDLLVEGLTWFGARGSKTLGLGLEVT